VLKILVENGLTPNLVITSPDKPVGRKQILTSSPVKQFATENGLKIETPKNKAELISAMEQWNNGTMEMEFGILAAYGLILPSEAVKILQKGILNIHPSLLPKYRGSSPIQSAILNGETETGVTIIKLNEKIDQGEIVAQEKIQIKPNDTTITLGEKLFTIGTNLLIKILPDYLDGKIKLVSQNIYVGAQHVVPLGRTWPAPTEITKKFTKQDGFIPLIDFKNAISCHSDESQNPSFPTTVDRKFRAFQPWPGIWTTLENGKRMLITKCHLESGVLKIDLVKIEGKQEEKFINF
jgi:methionyl-tRNA formyltransferase